MRALLPLLLLLLLLPTPAAGTSLLLVTDAEQARLSDAVVLAEVVEQRVERHPRWDRAVTRSTLRVREVLYGDAPATLQVSQLKGQLGDRVEGLPGSAQIEPGRTVVLFLHRVDGEWFPTAMEQSLYEVQSSRLGQTLVRSPLRSALYRRDEQGHLQPTAEPLRKPVRTLEAFREEMKALAPSSSAPEGEER